MTVDPGLTARVRSALADEADVAERRMFGSVGFMVRGSLRLTVGVHPDHVILVRLAPEDRAAALDRPGVRAAVMGERPMHDWVFLERSAVESDEQLAHWIGLALASAP